MQVVFDTSLAELLHPTGIMTLCLTCISCLLGTHLVQQSRQQDLSDLVSSVLPDLLIARFHSMDADKVSMQAMTYLFATASAGMISLDECLLCIAKFTALQQHAITQTLQAGIQSLKPHVDIALSLVQRLSHMTPLDVLCHVWPCYLETFASQDKTSLQVQSLPSSILQVLDDSGKFS